MPDVVVRPLGPGDRHAVRLAFEGLSWTSRHARWLGAKRELSDRELAALVAMDGWHRHGALAWAPGEHRPIGFASCLRTERFWIGEVAVAVADAWQGVGVGRALLEAVLASARGAGIDTIVATTLVDNHRARRLIARAGRKRSARVEAGVVEVEVAAASRRREPLSGR